MNAGQLRLFGEFASRYDLHTPGHHYADDHRFVLDSLKTSGHKILDVGCGTGILLRKALDTGFDAYGIDLSAGMVDEAARKAGADRVRHQSMETVEADSVYDGICALSWVINYAADAEAALDILGRFRRALKPGGRLLVQTAHAPNMDGLVREDREPGPSGEEDDIVFLFQFRADGPDKATARYVYAARSLGELMWEEHRLNVANADLLAGLSREAGFATVRMYGTYRRDPVGTSVSPWIEATLGP